jgi:hypothetical protein
VTTSTLTISAARNLAAAGASSATYYRAFDGDVEVDRGHIPAAHRSWPVDATIAHLEAGRTVELREGAADGRVAHRFTAIDPGVRAAI